MNRVETFLGNLTMAQCLDACPKAHEFHSRHREMQSIRNVMHDTGVFRYRSVNTYTGSPDRRVVLSTGFRYFGLESKPRHYVLCGLHLTLMAYTAIIGVSSTNQLWTMVSALPYENSTNRYLFNSWLEGACPPNRIALFRLRTQGSGPVAHGLLIDRDTLQVTTAKTAPAQWTSSNPWTFVENVTLGPYVDWIHDLIKSDKKS